MLAQQAGYQRPGYYSSDQGTNNIESLAAGYQAAAAVWTGWLESPARRMHVLAENAFYTQQAGFGIGYACAPSGSSYEHYWVLITAQPTQQPDVRETSPQHLDASRILICVLADSRAEQFFYQR